MDRRQFLEFAALGTASSLIHWPAFAQSKSNVLIAAEMNANSLDTHTVGANRAAYGLVWMTYDRLLQFGTRTLPNGTLSYDYFNLKPQLAESWQLAPDNSSVTFKLRKDVTFHDGAPMTAKDVKWSFDRFVKVGGFPQRQMEQGSLSDVDQFEVVDDYTFRVKLLRQDKLTMPSLAIVVPSIYNSELCKKNATAADPWALEWTKNNSAGSGAFKVDSFKPGEQVVLSRFDGWKGGERPKLERALYRSVAAAGTRRALVEKGDADISPDLPPRDVADLIAGKKFTVASAPMANTLKYLALSTIIKPFDDVKVRQAIAYAIPYQKVLDSSVFGRAVPMFGASANAPTDIAWPQPFPYNYDPAKAKALLNEAGLGSGFETKLFFDAQAATVDEPAALVIQDALGQLGVKVSIEKLPDFFARRTQKNWPMTIDVFGAWFDDPDFFFRWIWHGQNTIWNVSSYKNPEMDKLLDAARQEREKGAYAELVKKFLKLAMTDVPVIPLYQPTLDVVMQPDIKGYEYMFHRQVDARTLART
ncbi:MAG: ABC transporter substrate-binding protein [Pseudorhodoplanes sp.]